MLSRLDCAINRAYDEPMHRRLAPILIALITVVLAPAASATPERGAVFSGTGLWIDIYDAYEQSPEQVVAIAQQRGIPVIYVETSNAKSPRDVMYPGSLKRLVPLAHAAGIRVIPWYLAGYRKLGVDRRRLQAALRIGGADAVDGLAVDIESTDVKNGALRAKRAVAMMRWLRATYPTLAIGAIIPSPPRMYWPIFPYAEIRAESDAFLPMCYTSKYLSIKKTYAETSACVTMARELTGDPSLPVHVIAGVANHISAAQLAAAARGARDAGSNGFSLYDLATTRPGGWRAINTWATG